MPPVGFEPTISAGERQGRSPAEIVGSNPTGAWIFVCCECRVFSGRGLCDELITRPEESYRLWCVVCDLETSRMGAPYIYDISSLRVNIKQILIHVPCMMSKSFYLTAFHSLKSKQYTVSFLHVFTLLGCHHQAILMLTQAGSASKLVQCVKN